MSCIPDYMKQLKPYLDHHRLPFGYRITSRDLISWEQCWLQRMYKGFNHKQRWQRSAQFFLACSVYFAFFPWQLPCAGACYGKGFSLETANCRKEYGLEPLVLIYFCFFLLLLIPKTDVSPTLAVPVMYRIAIKRFELRWNSSISRSLLEILSLSGASLDEAAHEKRTKTHFVP